MQIGQFAKTCGVTVQTVRFYERRGLLPEPDRKPSGYRIYTEKDSRTLRFIRQAKGLGFSLDEIKRILATRQRGQCPCEDVLHIAEGHLRDVENQIRQLQTFRRLLATAIVGWKRSNGRNIPADAICVLIERTMEGRAKEGRPS